MMQQILENIFIYLALVFRPRALVKIARDYVAVSKQLTEQLGEATKMATELAQTLRDGRDTRIDDEPSEPSGEPPADASRGHEGGAA
jgi:hypothetical protein